MTKPIIYLKFILTPLLFLTLPVQTWAQIVNAITASQTAVLGSAYSTDKEMFTGGACLVGDSVLTGISQSSFNFSQSLSARDAEEQLGFSLGGRARFGTVTASAAAQFRKQSISSAFSISSVWLSDYTLPAYKLVEPRISTTGKRVESNGERWAETCGDKYVNEIQRGAKLFFSIRLDFTSIELKREFEAKFNIAGPLYTANATLAEASKEFSKNVKVTIAAYQVGGDVSKLTAVFGDSKQGLVKFVNCSLGNFGDCSEIIASALKYAANTNTGFPSQIKPNAKPGPVPLYYNLSSYSAAGIYLSNYSLLDDATKRARERLTELYEQQLSSLLRAERLLEIVSEPNKTAQIETEKGKIDSNISSIVKAAENCYSNPKTCIGAVEALQLVTTNKDVLSIPPPPEASFRVLTTKKGVWGRQESIDIMNQRVNRETLTKVYVQNEITGDLEYKKVFYSDFINLDEIKKKEKDDASIVLLIQGHGLVKADLFFEDTLVNTIPLNSSSIRFPDKKTGNSVSIVFSSTRTLPNWRDINIDTVSKKLMDNYFPVAEGFYYLVVTDEFGQKTRFDLWHITWKHENSWFVVARKRLATKKYLYSYRYNWWNPSSSGTNGRIDNDYTRYFKEFYSIDETGRVIKRQRTLLPHNIIIESLEIR